MLQLSKAFENTARKKGFYSKKLMLSIAKQGNLKNIKQVPKEVRKAFMTAMEIKPEKHVKMQAVFQKYTDNAVSKTVNLAPNAKPNDIEKIFISAYKQKCKGITVYRYGSKQKQVLYIGSCPGKTCN